MEKMSVDEVVTELRERISDLAPYIEEADSDSEYFLGVQDAYAIVIAMFTDELPETKEINYPQIG
jgi:hypothetical protein